MRSVRATVLTALFCAVSATPALADITVFIGANTTPAKLGASLMADLSFLRLRSRLAFLAVAVCLTPAVRGE